MKQKYKASTKGQSSTWAYTQAAELSNKQHKLNIYFIIETNTCHIIVYRHLMIIINQLNQLDIDDEKCSGDEQLRKHGQCTICHIKTGTWTSRRKLCRRMAASFPCDLHKSWILYINNRLQMLRIRYKNLESKTFS